MENPGNSNLENIPLPQIDPADDEREDQDPQEESLAQRTEETNGRDVIASSERFDLMRGHGPLELSQYYLKRARRTNMEGKVVPINPNSRYYREAGTSQNAETLEKLREQLADTLRGFSEGPVSDHDVTTHGIQFTSKKETQEAYDLVDLQIERMKGHPSPEIVPEKVELPEQPDETGVFPVKPGRPSPEIFSEKIEQPEQPDETGVYPNELPTEEITPEEISPEQPSAPAGIQEQITENIEVAPEEATPGTEEVIPTETPAEGPAEVTEVEPEGTVSEPEATVVEVTPETTAIESEVATPGEPTVEVAPETTVTEPEVVTPEITEVTAPEETPAVEEVQAPEATEVTEPEEQAAEEIEEKGNLPPEVADRIAELERQNQELQSQVEKLQAELDELRAQTEKKEEEEQKAPESGEAKSETEQSAEQKAENVPVAAAQQSADALLTYLEKQPDKKGTRWSRFIRNAVEIATSIAGSIAIKALAGAVFSGIVVGTGGAALALAPVIGFAGGVHSGSLFNSIVHYKIFHKEHHAPWMENGGYNRNPLAPFQRALRTRLIRAYGLNEKLEGMATVNNAPNLTTLKEDELLGAFKDLHIIQQLTNYALLEEIPLKKRFVDAQKNPISTEQGLRDLAAAVVAEMRRRNISGKTIEKAQLDAQKEVQNRYQDGLGYVSRNKAWKGGITGAAFGFGAKLIQVFAHNFAETGNLFGHPSENIHRLQENVYNAQADILKRSGLDINVVDANHDGMLSPQEIHSVAAMLGSPEQAGAIVQMPENANAFNDYSSLHLSWGDNNGAIAKAVGITYNPSAAQHGLLFGESGGDGGKAISKVFQQLHEAGVSHAALDSENGARAFVHMLNGTPVQDAIKEFNLTGGTTIPEGGSKVIDELTAQLEKLKAGLVPIIKEHLPELLKNGQITIPESTSLADNPHLGEMMIAASELGSKASTVTKIIAGVGVGAAVTAGQKYYGPFIDENRVPRPGETQEEEEGEGGEPTEPTSGQGSSQGQNAGVQAVVPPESKISPREQIRGMWNDVRTTVSGWYDQFRNQLKNRPSKKKAGQERQGSRAEQQSQNNAQPSTTSQPVEENKQQASVETEQPSNVQIYPAEEEATPQEAQISQPEIAQQPEQLLQTIAIHPQPTAGLAFDQNEVAIKVYDQFSVVGPVRIGPANSRRTATIQLHNIPEEVKNGTPDDRAKFFEDYIAETAESLNTKGWDLQRNPEDGNQYVHLGSRVYRYEQSPNGEVTITETEAPQA